MVNNYIVEIAKRIKAEVPAELIPDNSEELFNIYAVLVLSKGEQVGSIDVHNAWSAWISASNPNHESAIPFENLEPKVQAMDRPFVEAIKRVAKDLDRP